MYESIKEFNKQFAYEPEIINLGNLPKKSNFVVVGMGGSTLAAKLLKTCKPEIDITIHQDYGLPEIPEKTLKNKLIILSSYSGNTEEVIDAFNQAKDKNLDMAVIAVGGELLKLAVKNNIPFVKLPDAGVQPRMAIGLSLKAMLKLMGQEDELKKISALATTLTPTDYEKQGKTLAQKTKNYVPIIYASNRNLFLANIWKIKVNETGKIPCYYNALPEMNHNEMNSFDVQESTKKLTDNFYFIILKDSEDHPRTLKRMNVLEKLYKARNLQVETLDIAGENKWQKIFSSILLADWFAYYTALQYGLEPEQVPMVEEFKKLILE